MTFDELERPPTYYQGRLWDAPFTDDALPKDLAGLTCVWCQDPIEQDDDAIQLPYVTGHLECHLRSALGDVQHLEGRCICGGGPEVVLDSDKHLTYRDESKATLEWLLAHNRGRFHHD